MRRVRASLLMLAAFAMLTAGLGTACSAICCPLAPPQASVHAVMPCCAGPSTMSRPDAMRVPAATTTGRAVASAPVAAIVRVVETVTPARVEVSHVVSPARHEPSPPLFLLNAQLLI